ncbi:hypothetical protein ILUMI_23256 [Ignelater luminosus]|uniref:Uncharacterized protein n=1 Tax=Ignelater luminosus TaxID=2038154 RepID=A0A8K0CCD0_IGNLU|nr:hypothetical protein ILUMI_23256 [Ignelater luminosus]
MKENSKPAPPRGRKEDCRAKKLVTNTNEPICGQRIEDNRNIIHFLDDNTSNRGQTITSYPPEDIQTDNVTADLRAKNYAVDTVTRLHIGRERGPIPLVLVTLDRTENQTPNDELTRIIPSEHQIEHTWASIENATRDVCNNFLKPEIQQQTGRKGCTNDQTLSMMEKRRKVKTTDPVMYQDI